MAEADDKNEETLIDRLASTTNRLRNLFYINLLLAGAIFYLVYQDPGFVSEKIDPAMRTLEPIFKVDSHIKANMKRFEGYEQHLTKALDKIEGVSLALRQIGDGIEAMPEADRNRFRTNVEKELTDDQIDLIEELADLDSEYDLFRKVLASYLKLDLKASDYTHIFGFTIFLYADYWFPLFEAGHEILIKLHKHLPQELRVLELGDTSELGHFKRVTGLDGSWGLGRLTLDRYNDAFLQDTILENLLDSLPDPDDIFESFVIIETFCTANGLGLCSIHDIEKWQAKQSASSPGKLSAPGIEVDVTRALIIPASPVILLIAQHLFMLQFRRREILRKELQTGHSPLTLNLLDESWILSGLVLNIAAVKSIWRRVQSALMMAFLCFGEAAPFLAVVAAGHYIFMQIVLGGVIAKEFATAMADLKENAKAMGVEQMPVVPEAPGLFWEYLWLAVTVVSGMILLGSLIQLFRDQYREVFQTSALSGRVDATPISDS